MRKMTCEMCGSHELIKQEGMYKCESCGVKYAPEEARKLIIEGPVEVFGEVRVDYGNLVANALTVANRAFDEADFSTAQTQAIRVLEHEPNNYQAIAIAGLSRMMNGPIMTGGAPDFDAGITAIHNATTAAVKESALDAEAANKILQWIILVSTMLVHTINTMDAESKELKRQSTGLFVSLSKGIARGVEAIEIKDRANQYALHYLPIASLFTPDIISLTANGKANKRVILNNIINRFHKKTDIYQKALTMLNDL